jgi:nucleoside phosphorylase
MTRSVILFLAANPIHMSMRALGRECLAIERELMLTPGRDELELQSRWAVTVDDVMRYMLQLQPAVVHFTGVGNAQGLLLEDELGRAQLVTAAALTRMVRAAASARLAVLNACCSDAQAGALSEAVGCAIGMRGAVSDDAAREFAVGFYRALGHHRSVGNAYEHAVATLEGKGLTTQAEPRCIVRAGIDVETLVLHDGGREAVAPNARRPGGGGAARDTQADPTRAAPIRLGSPYRGKIDFGIVTIREDENAAVLQRFEGIATEERRRRYRIRRLTLATGGAYTLAVVRCLEQGTTEAQAATYALLEDLEPRFVLVVGIAGGVPSHELSLGDVVVSNRIIDFSVEAVIRGGGRQYALGGGPLHPEAAKLAADIASAIADGQLDSWSSPDAITHPRPGVDLSDKQLYGDNDWKRSLRGKLEHHVNGRSRPPLAITGAIASSDRLIKDDETLARWLQIARQVVAVEMESAGVYRATHEHSVPLLAIRGISDVVGLKREPGWTAYACHSAAAFVRAFLATRPIEPVGV